MVSIGRLDLNTEGLLLLTNDGGLARALELPATGWLRRYRVRAHGKITQAQLDGLRHGIEVDGIRYGAIEATLDREQGSNVWLTFAMREGKNREIRNVLGHLGLAVNRLIRVSYGPFQLGDLPDGAVEEVKTRALARAARRAHRRGRRRGFFRAAGGAGRARRRSACQPPEVRAPSPMLGGPRAAPRASKRGGRRGAPDRSRKSAVRRRSSEHRADMTMRQPPGPAAKGGPHRPPRATARKPRETATSRRARRPSLQRPAGPLMRIVGGRFRGRTLAAPKSQAIRPTADRLRESLFNILTHSYGDPVEGARVLDLFAGTGALGLEALSRGAAFVLFVDDGAEARALLRGNVDALGAGGATQGLSPRCDQARAGASDGAVLARLPRSALWQGPGRAGADFGARRRLAHAPMR